MEYLGIAFLFIGIFAIVTFLGGWVTMLCLGALAHIFGLHFLAIGFWPSCLVSFILGLLFRGGSYGSSD